MEQQLIEDFKTVLDDKNSTENTIQEFLEANSELIPLPVMENHNLHMGAIISKFIIADGEITDFAYLTKSTNRWKFVLIELESPHKKIFKSTKGRIEFSAEFNNAVDQIRSWKAYITDNRDSVLKKIDKIRVPLNENTVFFEYVLIIGCRGEYESSVRKNRMLAQVEADAQIKIMTYDSLISKYTYYSGVDCEKIILSPWGDQGFKIKGLPKGSIETALFSYVQTDYLDFNGEQEKRLEADGYMISEWRKGKLLAINNKKPDEPEYFLGPLRKRTSK